MELTARNYETRVGEAIRIDGDFNRDFYESFLGRPMPYAFCCADHLNSAKEEQHILGYSIYTINSKEHGQMLLEQITAKIIEAGHSLAWKL